MTCDLDVGLIDLAGPQHGVFSRAQVKDLGYSDRQIAHRVSRGQWLRLSRTVYRLAAVGLTKRGVAVGAVMAIPDSVLSHEFAAEIHGFPNVRRGRVALTVPPGSTHRFPGATIHEYEGITDIDRWSVDGLPVTAPALTVMHLSAIMPIKAVGAVLDDCLVTRRVRLPELFALADFWTRRGRPGGKAMWRLLESRGSDYVPPESELERRFLALLGDAGVPEPTRQFEPPWEAGPGRIDFAFVKRRVLIEVDGRRWHTRERDFEKDKARDREAQLQGWMILRFGWNEVTCRPDLVLRDIVRSLGE